MSIVGIIFHGCNHKYGKWGDPIQVCDSFKKQQARRCEKCGRVKVRCFRTELVNAIAINDSIKD